MNGRGQTAIEYLLLVGASIFFVIVVALNTRNTILPVGTEIPGYTGEIVTAEASFIVTATPIVTDIVNVCTPGQRCGISTRFNTSCPRDYDLVQGCAQTCNRVCIADGTCGSCNDYSTCSPICVKNTGEPKCVVAPNPNSVNGPATSNVTVYFFNMADPNDVNTATISCNNSDNSNAGVIRNVISKTASKNCSFPMTISPQQYNIRSSAGNVTCSGIVTDNPPIPICVLINANPSVITSTRQSQIRVRYSWFQTTSPTFKCNQTDPGSTGIGTMMGLIWRKNCDYPNVSSTTNVIAIVSTIYSSCNTSITIQPQPPSPSCTLSSNPDRGNGPFSSVLNATFYNLPSGTDEAVIKCSDTDPGVDVPITNSGGAYIATRTCQMSQVTNSTDVNVSASAGGAVCGDTVTVDPPAAPACTIYVLPNGLEGPFQTNLKVYFQNLPDDTVSATIKCNSTDAGTTLTYDELVLHIIGNKYCNYPDVNADSNYTAFAFSTGPGGITSRCNATVVDLAGPPRCELTASPAMGKGPFSSTITARFYNLPPEANTAMMRCTASDAYAAEPVVNLVSTRACPYPAVSGTTNMVATAVINDLNCSTTVQDTNTLLPPTCTLTITPSFFTGPRTATADMLITNYDSAYPRANIKCTESDSGQDITVNSGTQHATRSCNYPAQGSEYRAYIPSGTYCNGNGCTTCNATVLDSGPLPQCNVNQCSLPGADTSLFYHFIVEPQHLDSPATINTWSTIDSCYSGGPVCKERPCRVRGSKNGENSCYLIEDWVDFDWNDFIWSVHVFNFPNGDKYVEVTDEACDTSAVDKLTMYMDFNSPKYVKDYEGGTSVRGTSLNYLMWPGCLYSWGRKRTFLISDNPIESNYPPTWSTIPDTAVQSGQSPPPIDLWSYVNDDHTPVSSLVFAVDYQSYINVINCYVQNNRYLTCDNALNTGSSQIRLSATDAGGLKTTTTFNIQVVYLTFNLPDSLQLYNGGGRWSVDLNSITRDFSYTDRQLTFAITQAPDPNLVTCQIVTSWPTRSLQCTATRDTRITGTTSITITVTDPAGVSVSDTMPIVVV